MERKIILPLFRVLFFKKVAVRGIPCGKVSIMLVLNDVRKLE